MLSHLHIRNLAVVDEVEVELTTGMTTLTGETGAGKSILIDALGLALGERADSEAVRPGAKRAEVAASFELPDNAPALAWLDAEPDRPFEADDKLTWESRRCRYRRLTSMRARPFTARCRARASQTLMCDFNENGTLSTVSHTNQPTGMACQRPFACD